MNRADSKTEFDNEARSVHKTAQYLKDTEKCNSQSLSKIINTDESYFSDQTITDSTFLIRDIIHVCMLWYCPLRTGKEIDGVNPSQLFSACKAFVMTFTESDCTDFCKTMVQASWTQLDCSWSLHDFVSDYSKFKDVGEKELNQICIKVLHLSKVRWTEYFGPDVFLKDSQQSDLQLMLILILISWYKCQLLYFPGKYCLAWIAG